MPHAMYFIGDSNTVTKINQVPYQTIEYNDNGMFTAKLMNDTPIKIFINNGATPSILPWHTYNKFPILHKYSKTESKTPIHTGGGLITSHFWCTIPVPIITLYLCHILVSSFTTNLHSTELHLQGVAPRSQYSDPMLEAVTLQ